MLAPKDFLEIGSRILILFSGKYKAFTGFYSGALHPPVICLAAMLRTDWITGGLSVRPRPEAARVSYRRAAAFMQTDGLACSSGKHSLEMGVGEGKFQRC